MTLQTVVQTDSYPIGIAVDPANDDLYYVSRSTSKLSRCNLDGSNMTVISTLRSPCVIRLDLTDRYECLCYYELSRYVI